MDYSANFQDFEDVSDVSSFYPSNLFESTPKTNTANFYSNVSKKRKFTDIKGRRKLNDLLESSSSAISSPNLSNECLSKDFQNIKIEPSYSLVEDYDEPASKYFKNNGCEKIVTPPSTPESHLKLFDSTPKKSGSFQKCSSACSVPSPLKEQHEILYPNLKPFTLQKKPLTPQKLKEKIDGISYNSTPYRKQFHSKNNRLINEILTNDVVMEKIFRYMSDGDLFRVSMVSKDFKNALERTSSARIRYERFKESLRKNKENYKITPPSSPESQNMFLHEPVSPRSQKFRDYIELGSQLSLNQTLNKCPRCRKPSVVENSIGQCQNGNCGYIYCQKCDSFAFCPETFTDQCRGITLGQSFNSKRKRFEDLSNSSPDFNASSILNSTAENYSSSNALYSSGYVSGYDTSHTPLSVKRNLSESFHGSENISRPQKALFDSNRSMTCNGVSVKSQNRDEKRKSYTNVAQVVQSDKKFVEVKEPASPPPKTYSACSKQSKKMLKRLTR